MAGECYLTVEEYAQTQAQLVTLSALLADMPLDRFVNSITRAETVAPVLNPTLYQQGGRNLDEMHRLADAALQFQRVILELRKGGRQ